jgi:hypothetical protein
MHARLTWEAPRWSLSPLTPGKNADFVGSLGYKECRQADMSGDSVGLMTSIFVKSQTFLLFQSWASARLNTAVV